MFEFFLFFCQVFVLLYVSFFDIESLRYPVQGLFINILHHFWPELLRIPGFLTQFITPIVQARHGSKTAQFFTLPEYRLWRESHPDWRAKYYKGLGLYNIRRPVIASL